MKIGPLGIVEILIILAVVLIIFGPKNLPKLGSAIGKAVKNLREGIGSGKKQAKDAAVKAESSTADDGEVVEVIDKPKPSVEASHDAPTDTQSVPASGMKKPKPKSQVDSATQEEERQG